MKRVDRSARKRADVAPRALLAECDWRARDQIVAMLVQLGFEVDTTTSGRQAVSAAVRESYHVVLINCAMPEMNGIPATELIRRHENQAGLNKVPIVALAADATACARDACLRAGMNDTLATPIDFWQLAAMLERWVPEWVAQGSGAACD